MQAPDIDRLARGARAGLLAGVVSSAPGLTWALASGRGPWQPVRLIATMVGGRPGRGFALVPVATGGGIHLALSIAYGAAFLQARGDRARHPLLVGTAFGLLLHVVNLRLLARHPRVAPLRAGTSEPVELLAHALYGATLGAAVRRR